MVMLRNNVTWYFSLNPCLHIHGLTSVFILLLCNLSKPWAEQFTFRHDTVSIRLSVTAGVMGEYEPKIEVQFPEVVPVAKSSTVKLECFALGKYVPMCDKKTHSQLHHKLFTWSIKAA